MKLQIKKLTVQADSRGSFTEVLRREDTGPRQFGQISITTANKGETKGGHYHKRKREWYFILQGKAKFVFRDRKTKEQRTMTLDRNSRKLIEIPANVFHSVTNIGPTELIILIYISEPYDKKDPDTFTV